MQTKVIYRKPLGNKKRKYRQERFIISTFKAKTQNIRRGLELCKEAGFNMVEFGWVNPKDSYDCVTACEEAGIDGIFQNWDVFGGFQTTEGEAAVDIPKLKEYIEYTKKYRHVAGYYVWDEPYVNEKIRAAAEQVRVMEEYDPERLPFTVAIPSYNDKWTWENGLFEEYLRKYTEIIEPAVLSLDYYPFVYKQPDKPEQLDGSKIFLDIALLRELSLERKIPMWFYFQAQDNVMTYGYENFAPEKVRLQVYLALLYGAVGLQYYNVYNGTITEESTKGPLFDCVKELNYQANQLGKTFMALKSIEVFHSPEVLAGNEAFCTYRQPLTDSEVLADGELPFRCSVGEFTDCEGNRYLLIQNRDFLENREFCLPLQKNYRIYTVSKEDGMQSVREENVKKVTVALEAGDGVLLRFQEAEEEAYLIDYVLQK